MELLARTGKAWHWFFVNVISRTHEHIPLFFMGLSWRATCCSAFAWVYFGTTSATQSLLQAEGLDALCVRMVDYAQKLEEERPSIPQQAGLETIVEDYEYQDSRSWDGLAGPWREYWDVCAFGLLKEQPVPSLGFDLRAKATSCSPYAWVYFSAPLGYPGDPG